MSAKEAEKKPAADYSSFDLSKLTPDQRAAYDSALQASLTVTYWKPKKEGDFLIGTLDRVLVQEFADDDTGEIKEERVAVMTLADGDSIRVGMSAVLLREFDQQEVVDGTELVIVYRGVGERKGKRQPPKLFSVQVVKKGAGDRALKAWKPKPRGAK